VKDITFTQNDVLGNDIPYTVPLRAWLNAPVQLVEQFWRLAFGIPDSVQIQAAVPAVYFNNWAIVVVQGNKPLVYYTRKLNPLAAIEIEYVCAKQHVFSNDIITKSHQTVNSVLQVLCTMRSYNTFGVGDPFCWGVGSLFWGWKYSQSIQTVPFREWIWNILAIG
jgi:hypothetical protein